MAQRRMNALVGFAVGCAGGLIGLGGGELRLPYLVGALRLTPHQAVPLNLVISLFIVVAAIPTRLLALRHIDLTPFLFDAAMVTAGAISAAYVGASRLRRLEPKVLRRLIFVLLSMLGVGMLLEAVVPFVSDGFLPAQPQVRGLAGLSFGLLVGAISSVLGVAGGEVIIPTLVFAFGIPIKAASSLSMLISLPTVAAGLVRHARTEALVDRKLVHDLVLPMGLSSVAGACLGGLAVGLAPDGSIKIGLGLLLVWSAWKVFANSAAEHRSSARQESAPCGEVAAASVFTRQDCR